MNARRHVAAVGVAVIGQIGRKSTFLRRFRVSDVLVRPFVRSLPGDATARTGPPGTHHLGAGAKGPCSVEAAASRQTYVFERPKTLYAHGTPNTNDFLYSTMHLNRILCILAMYLECILCRTPQTIAPPARARRDHSSTRRPLASTTSRVAHHVGTCAVQSRRDVQYYTRFAARDAPWS